MIHILFYILYSIFLYYDRLLEEATELMQKIERLDIKPDAPLLNAFLKLHVERKDKEKIKQTYEMVFPPLLIRDLLLLLSHLSLQSPTKNSYRLFELYLIQLLNLPTVIYYICM